MLGCGEERKENLVKDRARVREEGRIMGKKERIKWVREWGGSKVWEEMGKTKSRVLGALTC